MLTPPAKVSAPNAHYVQSPHLTLESPRPAPTNSPKPAKTPHYHPLIRRFSTLQHEPLIGRSDAVIRRKSAGHPETAKASKLRKLRALVKPPNVRRLMAAFGRWPTSAARQWGAQPPSGSPPGRRERAKGGAAPNGPLWGLAPTLCTTRKTRRYTAWGLALAQSHARFLMHVVNARR